MSKGKAYLVPVAKYGFHYAGPLDNPIGWGLDDEDGRIVEVGGLHTWRDQDTARAEGTRAGYEVQS